MAISTARRLVAATRAVELGFQVFWHPKDAERARQQDKEFGSVLDMRQADLPEGHWLERKPFICCPDAADGVVLGRPYTGPLLGSGIRVVQISSIDDFRNRGSKVDGKAAAREENPALAHLLAVQRNARTAADRLSADIEKAGNATKLPEFPKTAIGQQLSQVARLIQINAGVAAIKVSHGGFDTHVNQLGTHERLLTELAEALAVSFFTCWPPGAFLAGAGALLAASLAGAAVFSAACAEAMTACRPAIN